MRRELGGFERAQAWTGASYAYNAVTVLRLAGRPRAAALESALAALQRRHPLLGARLVREGGRWRFESSAAAVPIRQIERRGEEHWREVAEEELDHRFEADAAPLVRCALMRQPSGGQTSEIVLAFHHVIADAPSGATVCRQLLGLLGGVIDELPAAAGEGMPPAPDDRFPARFRGPSRYPLLAAFLARQLAGEVGYLWRSRGLRRPPAAGPAHCRVLPVALGEEATGRLVRRCRRERVPLNGALNAALLLAVQRHRYDGRALPLRYFAFPDLRPYLDPPAGPEPVASYLTTMRFNVGLGTGERFWELARRVEAQLLASFRRGEKFLFCMTSAALLRMLIALGRLRLGSTAVSHTGPLELPESSGELRVRGLHAFVSNMTIGPEYTALTRLYRGRLWWDILYLDVDMDEAEAGRIAADILDRLEAAAAA